MKTVIRYTVGTCTLGRVLVAASDHGICAVTLGDDPDVLTRDLQRRFPRAQLIEDRQSVEHAAAAIISLIDHPHAQLDHPIDARGTAFQQQVWQALRAIPAGSTAAYADIATRIGKPRAVRAVAQACGANPVAVAIPCHRVVRSDGSLSGYRWGTHRKAALLAREGIRC